MNYCERADKYCSITQDVTKDTTLSGNTETILGLKDCSEKFCQYKGQEGCLLKTKK